MDVVKEKIERSKRDGEKHELFTKIPEGSIEQGLSLLSARLIVRSQHGFLKEHKLGSNKELFIGYM